MFLFGFVIRLTLIIWYVIFAFIPFHTVAEPTHHQYVPFNVDIFSNFTRLSAMFIFVGRCFKGVWWFFPLFFSLFILVPFSYLVIIYFVRVYFVRHQKFSAIFLIFLFCIRMSIESTFNRLVRFSAANDGEKKILLTLLVSLIFVRTKPLF